MGSPAAWSLASTSRRTLGSSARPWRERRWHTYGKGVQDGFVAGPEIRFDVAPFGGFNIGLKAAYDYQFRNAGWDESILGLPVGSELVLAHAEASAARF